METNIHKLKRTKVDYEQEKLKALIEFDDNSVESILNDVNFLHEKFKLIPVDGNLKVELFFMAKYENLTVDCYAVQLTVMGREYNDVSSFDTTFKSYVEAVEFLTCELVSPETKGMGLSIRMTDCGGASVDEMSSPDFRGMGTFMITTKLKEVSGNE